MLLPMQAGRHAAHRAPPCLPVPARITVRGMAPQFRASLALLLALFVTAQGAGRISAQSTVRGAANPPATFADPDRRAKLATAFPEIDRMVADFMARAHVPGAAWGIVIDGELAHIGVPGHRDLPRKSPVTRDSVFRIASMTKSFTAMAILKLRDEGKLSLDDLGREVRPRAEEAALPDHRFAEDHGPASAVARGRFPRRQPVGRPAAGGDRRRSSRRCCEQGIPFSNPPGVAYEYANYGFAILGRIVTNVSGTPYRRLHRGRDPAAAGHDLDDAGAGGRAAPIVWRTAIAGKTRRGRRSRRCRMAPLARWAGC